MRITVMIVLAALAFQTRGGTEDFYTMLDTDPGAVFLEIVRTGIVPDSIAIRERTLTLLREDPLAARLGAWACWSAGIPLEAGPEPVLVEFAGSTFIPVISGLEHDQLLIRAALVHPLHHVAMQMETDTTDLLPEFIVREWPSFSSGNRILALQVLGKLGMDVTDRLSEVDLRESGAASLLRYLSELGLQRDDIAVAGLPLLARLYAARVLPEDGLGEMLEDPHWSVRFTAAERAPVDDLAPLLGDSVGYIRLTAALRLMETGNPEAADLVREMAAVPGPLGHMAVYGLSAEDSVMLLGLLESQENGKRTAALEAWFDSGLPLGEERVREFSRNSHWLVPLFLAWNLEESGEHDLALLVHETVITDTQVYDESLDLVIGLESLLGITDASTQTLDIELPFDPDTVTVPDTLLLATDIGQFKLVLWHDIAPVTCASFTWLARNGFYDGIWFHRVIPGFVAQAGCPDGTGMGGPGYTIPNERSLECYTRGVVGMADAGLDTGGSQFFVMLDDHNRLDGRYTAFGEIIPDDGIDDITVGTRILWLGDYRH